MKFFTAFVAFLIFAFVAQTSFAQKQPRAALDYFPENWKEYQYTSDNVKFRFPAEPSVNTTSENTSGFDVITKKFIRRSFLVMELWVVSYPSDVDMETIKPIRETIKFLRDGALQGLKGFDPKIIEEADIKVDGHAGKFIHVEGNNGEVLRLKFFLVKNRMYYAFVSVKKGGSGVNSENDYENVAMSFLDSIRIISPQ